MRGHQQQPTRGVLPINLSNRKAKGTGSMSRAQMKSMAYNDKQKIKKKLAQKLQLSDSERVPDDLIREYQHRSHLDRLQTLLHSEVPNFHHNTFHGKSVRRFPGGLKRNSSNQAFEEGKADPMKQLPFNPQRQHVQWLSFSEQGRNQIDLANEIEKFSNYVSLTESERNLRDGMVRDVQEAITSKWQAARIHQFGSHSVGLSIFLSDIDISVLGLGEDGKGAAVRHHSTDKAFVQVQETGTGYSEEAAADEGDWDAEEMDDEEDEDGEIAYAENESSSNESGTDGAVYSDVAYEETARPDGDENDAEVGWFVDVKGNPDLLKAGDDGSSLPKTPQNDLVKGVGRKRPLLVEDHEVEKGDDEIDEESGDIDSNDDSDEEGDELEVDENRNHRSSSISTPAFKMEVGQSSTSAKKPMSSGQLISEDLVVQYRDENSLCVVTSSLKKATNAKGKQREIIFVDLVSDDDVDEKEKQSSEVITEKKKVRNSVMDFSNVFDSDQLALPNFGRKPELKSAESVKLHKFQLSLLRDLLPHLKSMDWVRSLEFRGKAKVPIINFEHKNGLQCDMSIGISTQDTSAVVQRLKDVCGAPFVPLAAFLKVLLYQQNLDKPFTGGLGSFKLYIILAYHLLYNQSMFSSAERNNPLGLQLLTFLRYFGSPRNLNQHSEISMPILSEKVSFLQTFQVDKVRRLFEKCYAILHRICKERVHSNNRENSQISATEQPERSYSALGYIIDSFQLSKERTAYLTRSRRYPVLTDAEKDAVAAEILRTLAAKNPSGLHMHVDIEQVKTLNPRMAARLRSFLYADQAFSGSSSNRRPDAASDRANKRRRIDEPNSSIDLNNISATFSFQHDSLPAKAFPQLSKKITKAALRRNDAAVTKYIHAVTADGAALPGEILLKIRDLNVSEGLKLKLSATDFRPENLLDSTKSPLERVALQNMKKCEEAEKLKMMSAKLKEKLLQLKKQAEAADQGRSIADERGSTPSVGANVQSQSQTHSSLPEPHQQPCVAGKKNKITLVTSTGKDDDGNAFYDDPCSFSCPNPLSQPTIAAHPSSSGKAIVEVVQGKGQSERTETTKSCEAASVVSTLERIVPVDARSNETGSRRPPTHAPLPLVQDRGSHTNRSNGKDKGKDSAFFMMRQSTSNLMKVIDDLDCAIAVRMKS